MDVYQRWFDNLRPIWVIIARKEIQRIVKLRSSRRRSKKMPRLYSILNQFHINFWWSVLKWTRSFFSQVGGPLQSPVPGSNLPYSFPYGYQQQPPGGASGPGSGGGPSLWGNPRPHVSSFPLRPELQPYEPYSPVRGFPVADQMSLSSDSYLMNSTEWGLKQSHIHDKPKVLLITLHHSTADSIIE